MSSVLGALTYLRASIIHGIEEGEEEEADKEEAGGEEGEESPAEEI